MFHKRAAEWFWCPDRPLGGKGKQTGKKTKQKDFFQNQKNAPKIFNRFYQPLPSWLIDWPYSHEIFVIFC